MPAGAWRYRAANTSPRRASMVAQMVRAACRCAYATRSRLGTATIGSFHAWASALALATPTRRPVPTAMPASELGSTAAWSRTQRTEGASSSAWARSWRTATEAHGPSSVPTATLVTAVAVSMLSTNTREPPVACCRRPIVALAGSGTPVPAQARCLTTDDAGMARVLVVQADEQRRANVVADLRAEGHDVVEASSADRGVAAARDAEPEIILLDPMLPDRSGYEVYAALQRDPDTVAIPVLFLPGRRQPGQTSFQNAGVDLVTRLGLALRTKNLHDELRLGDPRLRTAVLTDSLTGLANRRAAEERLRLASDLARAGAGPLSIVLTDLDGFAAVNDQWGYAVGDHVLQAFAGLLHESCRGDDTIARFEGEAFLLVLSGTKLDEAWHVAERVRERTVTLGAVMQSNSAGPALSASFGVAAHNPDDTWDGLLTRAADALQRAKRTGRNRCEVA